MFFTLSFVAALIVALFFSWFPIIANGLVLTTAFPLGDEAGLPFTVPFKSTENYNSTLKSTTQAFPL